jgi:hypothetical protein
MVWWEDISDAEDTNIQHPGLGVETCHRSKRRWCVRVAENASAPTTPSAHSFGVRYLLLSTLSRTASANIEASMFSSESYGHSLKDIEVNGTFSATALSVVNGGGLGSSDALNDMMELVDEQLVRRRAFSAVLTQGTTTTGGDYDSADAVDNLDTIDGTFFIRRGVYEWNIKTSLILPDIKVVGEKVGGSTEIAISSSHVSDFTISGTWERLYLDSHNNDRRYILQGPITLRDVTFSRGACQISGGTSDAPYLWFGGGTDSAAGSNTNSASVYITDSVGDPNGLIEGCNFYGPPGGAGSPSAVVECSSMAVGTYKRPLTFRDCHFRNTAGTCPTLLINNSSVPLVFEDCNFYNSSDTYYVLEIINSTNIVFRNCFLYGAKGRIAKVEGGVTFESCEFECGGTSPTSVGQLATFKPKTDVIIVRDCVFKLNGVAMDPSTGVDPVIEFGGAASTGSTEQRLILEGVHVRNDATANAHRSDLVAVHGPSTTNTEYYTVCNGLIVDVDKISISADRGNNGISTRTAFISMKTGTSAPGFVASGIELLSVDNPAATITDTGNLISFDGYINVSNVVVSRDLISGTGDFAGTEGLISIQNGAEVHNLRARLGDIDMDTSGTTYVVWLDDQAKLLGGKLNGIQGGSTIPDGAFFRIGNNCSMRDIELVGSLDNDFRLMWMGDYASVMGCKFDLTPGVVRSLSTYFDIFVSTGVESQFKSNYYVADGPATTLNIYTSTGKNSMCHGNIFIDTDTTIAPTVTVTGTNSIQTDNIIATR